eukprot:SAG31_NODE_5940_length_2247_cov_2.822626_2_plen_146_part_00
MPLLISSSSLHPCLSQTHVAKNVKRLGIMRVMDALSKKYGHSPTDAVKDLFGIFDTDGSGLLESEEIEVMLGCGVNFGREEHVIHDLIKQSDTDGDGKLSLKEFTSLLAKTQAPQQARKTRLVETPASAATSTKEVVAAAAGLSG